jgi:hypothetical protein
MMVATTTTSLDPVAEAPRHRGTEEPKRQSAEAFLAPVRGTEKPLTPRACSRHSRGTDCTDNPHAPQIHTGARSASALWLFETLVLRCFSASALRRFGASVPRTGAREVVVVATIIMVPPGQPPRRVIDYSSKSKSLSADRRHCKESSRRHLVMRQRCHNNATTIPQRFHNDSTAIQQNDTFTP